MTEIFFYFSRALSFFTYLAFLLFLVNLEVVRVSDQRTFISARQIVLVPKIRKELRFSPP